MLLFVLPACYDPEFCQTGDPNCTETEPPKEPNSYECHCTCGIDVDGDGELDPDEEQITHELQACMLPAHNQNLGGDYSPSDLTNDCRDRVRTNLQKIGRACIAGDDANSYICRNCEALAVTTPAVECDDQCDAVPLVQDPDNCTNSDPLKNHLNLKAVTNHPDEEPVCLAMNSDPPLPTASPLGSGIFGRVTSCNVTGTAQMNIAGDRRPGAEGVVFFTGDPCPGGTCDVGMFFKLGVHDFEATGGGFLGAEFGKAEFKEMRGWGASVPGGAALDASGAGRFEAGELLSTGRGVTDTFFCDPIAHELCDHQETIEDTILARNDGPLDVTIAWSGDPRCSVRGAVSTLGDGFAVDLAGPIVNQPPQARAGADQAVECTSAGGASVTLDGSASSDPDENIKIFSWRRGGGAGESVGLESVVDVNLGVGDTQNYMLTVVDAAGQASQDSVLIGVADTTAPSVACNAQPTITPNDGLDEDDPTKPPIAFTATATDTCDPSAGARIVGFDCFAFTSSGKRIDKKASCAVAIDAATIAILNSGGVDTHIQWTVRGADASGKTQHHVCEVLVVKP